ncbi:hypothetical protein I3842_09G175600 [Carya illinoinensis]|uniref:Uncharacterized protein n=1 Tax=Carya illinoinensis TaxID=32201 RepID=A0A922E549_CARIL|nr:hypothetical protein I3842_09G175600 [Carya illinoinensis]
MDMLYDLLYIACCRVLLLLYRNKRKGLKNIGDARCEFFVWTDIYHLLDQNIQTRENKVWSMWDEVLLRECQVQKREDKVKERERTLKKENRKLLCLY